MSNCQASGNKMGALKWVLTLLLALMGTITYGQADTSRYNQSKNSIYLELFGNAIGYSMNYERLVLDKKRFKIAARGGAAYFPPAFERDHYFVALVEFTGIIGKRNHYLEFGSGLTFIYQLYEGESAPNWILGGTHHIDRGLWKLLSFRIGYRYHSPRKGLILRIGITPLFEIADSRRYSKERSIIPIIGISAGQKLGKKRK